jgi:hypothetical protein
VPIAKAYTATVMPLGTVRFGGSLVAVVALLVAALAAQVEISRDHQCEYACNNGPRPACEVTWRPNVSTVFLGTVTRVGEEDVPIVLDGEKALTERLTVTFRVEESFRGATSRTLSVVSGGDLCGFPFSKGKQYLVFADSHPGDPRLHVDICSQTKWASDASDDLAYLRNLRSLSDPGYVYGSVFQFSTPEAPGTKAIRLMKAVANQRIRVQGVHSYEATTDSRGNFRVNGIEPGPYTVSIVGASSVYPSNNQAIRVENKGCAMVDFKIDPFSVPQPK